MPGEASRSGLGPSDDSPYVPPWCYDAPGPKMCKCGDHEGFHNDKGQCLKVSKCGCLGFQSKDE